MLLNMVPGIDGLAPPPFNLYALANETGATLPLTQALALRGAILTPREKTVWVVFPRLSEGRWRLLRFANLEHGLAYLAGAAAPANSETFWVKANEVATVTPRW